MNVLDQVEKTLKEQLAAAVEACDFMTDEKVPDIQLQKPREKEHGDFATNVAMQLTRIAKRPPREIAEQIVAKLDYEAAQVERVDIAGPGFINFYMKDDFLANIVATVLEQGEHYGETNYGQGKRVQVEFVSVNPTGDLHLGHARGAAFGDVLSNVFAAAGYDVDREYYINDAGNQIDQLAKSIEARYFEALGLESEMPEDGYFGDDIIDIGKRLAEEDSDKWVHVAEDERLRYFREYGLEYELGKIKTDLDAFGVFFDRWFSEMSLYDSGKIDDTLAILKEKGYIYEKDDATWFKSTEFGDDKDRVLIKSDGTYTYLTPDIAYHRDKLLRGYDEIINVWGADHHGYIARMNAAIQALGYAEEVFHVCIMQLVNLYEDGERVRMSKRTGKAVALRELMEEVGTDAVRYFFTMRSNDSQLDFDISLAKSQSNENPVYYVQYAHARICTMLAQAEKQGFSLDTPFDATLLQSEREQDLLKQLAAFPQVIIEAADRKAPHRLTQYVHDLAASLHSFYNAEKVINEDNEPLTHARMALMRAVQLTLQNALNIIGVEAPEKM
ncbi:MAG TPA: arginine--tRNA ligase [Pseudogracilibacillus sp.]|nr:arginine--tRNA ligase [Pseudogracilibacillus sp.]